MTRNMKILCGAGLFLASAVAAYAGSPITGVGASPREAMDDANARASQESMRRWGRSTCYSQAIYERCSKDNNGYWVCTAYVNNEPGSSC